MMRPSLAELERRCQKPDHRRIGNWMARRISRPAALRITWLVLPSGISANRVTLVAWLCGVAAACGFGWGSPLGWLLGAVLLQIWYLLDHVDGQLARYHGTASLDGVALDYLMHHTVALLVPLGVGCGLASRSVEPLWALTGLIWGVSVLVLGLHHDVRYKAFIQRLKRLHGRLEVLGGGGGRPQPAAGPTWDGHALAGWSLRKACEIQITMNVLSLLACGMLVDAEVGLLAAKSYAFLMGCGALTAAIVLTARGLNRGAAEQEFAAWHRVPNGQVLLFRDGFWFVEPDGVAIEHLAASNVAPASRSS